MTETSTSGAASPANALPEAIRSRLAIALDVDDLVMARRLVRELQPWFGTAKIGMELYLAAGPDAIGAVAAMGLDVFCDLKLHDIPTTVGRAARVLGALGARYLTLHTTGGVPMLRAGAEGFREGAAIAGLEEPIPLAVTMLTSDMEPSDRVLRQRVVAGLEGGCGGFFCTVPDAPVIRELAPAATLVSPGIRAPRAPADDQARVATPREALDAGVSLMVIGRAVTQADDPARAAAELLGGLAGG